MPASYFLIVLATAHGGREERRNEEHKAGHSSGMEVFVCPFSPTRSEIILTRMPIPRQGLALQWKHEMRRKFLPYNLPAKIRFEKIVFRVRCGHPLYEVLYEYG